MVNSPQNSIPGFQKVQPSVINKLSDSQAKQKLGRVGGRKVSIGGHRETGGRARRLGLASIGHHRKAKANLPKRVSPVQINRGGLSLPSDKTAKKLDGIGGQHFQVNFAEQGAAAAAPLNPMLAQNHMESLVNFEELKNDLLDQTDPNKASSEQVTGDAKSVAPKKGGLISGLFKGKSSESTSFTQLSKKMSGALFNKSAKWSGENANDISKQFSGLASESEIKEYINSTDESFKNAFQEKIEQRFEQKLSELDTKLKQNSLLDNAVKQAKTSKQTVKLKKKENNLPFAVSVSPKGQVTVHSKAIMGKGLEKTVKFGFDLKTGKGVARMSDKTEGGKPWTKTETKIYKKLGEGIGLPKTEVYKFKGKGGVDKTGMKMAKYDFDVDNIVANDTFRSSPKAQFKLLYQLGSGLKTMHENHITHGDFKPANCFVNFDSGKPGNIDGVVADMGMAVDFSDGAASWERLSEVTGTDNYDAPEQKVMNNTALESWTAESQEAYLKNLDIYAFATSAFEVLTGDLRINENGGKEPPPWRGEMNSPNYDSEKVSSCLEQLGNNGCPKDVVDLLKRSLVPVVKDGNLSLRPSMDEWVSTLKKHY